MRLVFEEEEEDGEAGAVGSSSRGPQEPTAQDAGWDAGEAAHFYRQETEGD